VRSPLTHVNEACQTCHREEEQELINRVSIIQDRTARLLRDTDQALVDAIDAIKAARAGGATEADLADALQFHRKAWMCWDFVATKNSTGFHSPQEAARILANAIDYACQAQLLALKLTPRQ